MFFESPCAEEVPEEAESSTTGVVKVMKGDVSEAQTLKRLRELALGDFQWELIRLEDNNFKVEFSSAEDLERLLSFGMCRVPGTECILEFLEWKKVEPQGKPLTQVWLRFSGVPSKLIWDVRVAAISVQQDNSVERNNGDSTRQYSLRFSEIPIVATIVQNSAQRFFFSIFLPFGVYTFAS